MKPSLFLVRVCTMLSRKSDELSSWLPMYLYLYPVLSPVHTIYTSGVVQTSSRATDPN